MFAYCLNSPTLLSDSAGSRPTISGGPISQETAEERHASCQYMSQQTAPSDLIIYYYNENSSANFDNNANNNAYSINAQFISVADHIGFLDALNGIEAGRVNNIYVYLHGADGELCFWQYSFDDFDVIPEIEIYGDVYLFACHGGSIASQIATSTGETVVATPYSVSFTPNGYARAGYVNMASHPFWAFNGIWREYLPNGNQNRIWEGIVLGN